MNDKEEVRFHNLRKELLNREEIKDIIGIDISDRFTGAMINQYMAKFAKERINRTNGKYSRFLIERMLLMRRFLPLRDGAVRLGMTKESLKKVLDSECSPFIYNTANYPEDLIDEQFIKDIHRFFEGTNNVIFKDHQHYCHLLHESIKNEMDLEVEPVYCTTSEALNETPKLFAFELCCISHEPTNMKYSVMMNFGKPLALYPDMCSKRFLYENKEELKEFIVGGDMDFSEFEK